MSPIISFLRDVWTELRRVTWPDRDELLRYTGVVIVFVVIIAAFIFGVDSLVAGLLQHFVYNVTP